ncbi:hypothetical protein PYCCODRAFT_1469943 [Trametes coccinea BRFM310]|uniref:Uncharacterized protein n=1 Tax=Trametes coccinea (strain BRFM310) TaxID=1353009 RepID=A0A1Y2IH00_TRAC3|nr:hypothetical protein PYCCODRAFT_1469943 [Trametes coccinea BRFM310]
MAPLRTRGDRFFFTSSFTINPDVPTRIELKLPSAPWRVRATQPTITRVFKSRRGTSGRGRKVDDPNKSESESGPSDSDSDSEPNEAHVPSRAGTPATQGQEGSSAPSGSTRTPTKNGAVFIDLLDAQGLKGKGRQSTPRASSVVSNVSTGEPTGNASQLVPMRGVEEGEANEPEIWTRYGVQNGEPVFIKRNWRSSTKDRDCVTSWWECTSRIPLKEPPNLSGRPELAIGDLFCNRVVDVATPRLWIWTSVGGTPTWRPISEGDTREDGRRLSITPKQKRPSWVKADWCVKQMLKHQRGQSVPA